MMGTSGVWLMTLLSLAASGAEIRVTDEDAPNSKVDSATRLHPPVPLLDRDGQSVLKSGQPVSTMSSCAGCHDTSYIAAHSFHVSLGADEARPVGQAPSGRAWDWSPGAFGRWSPLTYRYLSPPGSKQLDLGTAEWVRRFGWRHVGGGPAWYGHGERPLVDVKEWSDVNPDGCVLDPASGKTQTWDWQKSGAVELNCFLCHAAQPDNDARRRELADGRFGWANTATLARTGLVKRDADGWSYQADAFRPDGTVDVARLGLQEPKSHNCGLCHGVAEQSEQPIRLTLSLSAWSTATKGQVFSAQRISESAVNLANKQELARPWDVHAERLLECTSCHFSINNPAFYEPTPRTRPGHLRFEPRRLAIHEYLARPSHQFAKGHTSQGTVARHLDGTMRRCSDCHDASFGHDWLPYQEAHFARLSCEACHIPQTHASALQQIDWTLLSPQGEPHMEWRGLAGDPRDPTVAVTGFQPVLLPTRDVEGRTRLTPHNLISAWYWVAGGAEPRPVRQQDLEAALLTKAGYHLEVLKALDANTDGQVTPDEQRLDTPEKVEAVRRRLVAVGVEQPQIRAETQPYSLHHGVGPKRSATRDCRTCHAAESRLTEPFTLASNPPGRALPEMVGDSDATLSGELDEMWQVPIRVSREADGLERIGVDFNGRLPGQIVYRPDLRLSHLYVLGHSHWRWVDFLGSLCVIGVVLGVSGHAAMRVYTSRRGRKTQ